MKFAYTIAYVQNVARSIAFYEAAFGLRKRFVHESGQYGEMDTDGVTLAFADATLAKSNVACGIYENRRDRAPAGIELVFTTSDVRAAYDRAIAAGALPAAEPTQKPWGQQVAYVRDGDGVLVELCTPMGA